MAFRARLLLLILASLLALSAAQCELWAGEPSLCRDLLDGQTIYVGSMTQAQMVDEYSEIGFLSLAPESCQPFAVTFACLRYFPLCNTTALLPRRPCSSTCEQVFIACANELMQYADQLEDIVPANCSIIDQNGVDEFPNDTYIDQSYELQCTTSNSSITVDCPPPLKPYTRPKCFIECPHLFMSEIQFDAMLWLTLILSLVSFIMDLFLVPAYGFFPRARRWPARLLLYYFIANLLGTFGIIFSWKGRTVWCGDDGDTQKARKSALCATQGVLIVYSILSFELWWLSLIANLAYTLWLRKYFPIPDLWIEIPMHVINWGYPLAVVIRGAKLGKFSYVEDSPTCFMRGENADFLIWYPMTGIFSLGILLMFPVVLYVVLNAGTFGLRRQFRFLALITYNTFLFAFFIALWALARDKDDMYTRVLTEYVSCITRGETGCTRHPQPPYAIRLLLYVLLSASGAVYAGLFLSDGSLLLYWRKLYHEKRFPWSSASTTMSTSQHTSHTSRSRPDASVSGSKQGSNFAS